MSDPIDRDKLIDFIMESDPEWCVKPIRPVFDYIKEMPSVQPEPRWIPVEIKPPKEKKTYWVCTDTGYQCECRWTNNRFGMIASDEWGWSIFDTPQYTKVVAWRELPKLPEPYRKETEDAEIH